MFSSTWHIALADRLGRLVVGQTGGAEGATEAVDAAVDGATDAAAEAAESSTPVLESLQDPDQWYQYFQDYGIPAIKALILLFAAWVIAGWARRMTRRVLEKAEFDSTLTRFFSSMVRWVILLLAVIATLSIFGIETASFAVVLGSIGLALGMAFSGSLGNMAAGVMLLVFRPFKVGDVVNAAGVTAKVEGIELFTTVLDTPDNRRLIVPNGAIFGSTIENISHHPTRRVDCAVGVDYSADIDTTRKILEAAAAECNDAEAGDAAVVITGLGASSVDWVVRVWVKSENYWPTNEKLIRAVKMKLDEAGIGIPFPQMDVHLDGAVQR